MNRYMAKILCLFIILSIIVPITKPVAAEATTRSSTAVVPNSYSAALIEYEKNGYQNYTGEDIVINGVDVENDENIFDKQTRYENVECLTWRKDIDLATWKFNAPFSGLYKIKVDYYTIDKSSVNIERRFIIDGNTPYNELSYIQFQRIYKDKGKPISNIIGDEVAPEIEELHSWQSVDVFDADGMHDDPLLVYLEAGAHTLSMEVVAGSFAISEIRFSAPENIPSYSEKLAEYNENNYQEVDTDTQKIYIEAEDSVSKNSSIIRMISNSDPTASPSAAGKIKVNMIGGTNWSKGNTSITWKFKAPKSGLYKIAIRQGQNFREGMPSYRRIEIDGEVPFEEFKAFQFDFNRNLVNNTLSDSDGNPYLVYLDDREEHEITMTVKQGRVLNLINIIEADAEKLSDLVLKIIMITGRNPDPNYDYELDKVIPTLIDDLNGLSENLENCMAIIDSFGLAKRPAMYSQLKVMVEQYQAMIKNTFSIPKKLDDLNTNLTNYGNWLNWLKVSALTLDYIEFYHPEASVTNIKSKFMVRLKYAIINFFSSFIKEYDAVAGMVTHDGVEITETIDVWIGRGKDWGNLIKNLADSSFTPEKGIQVNINILPAGQLNAGSVNAMMLAIASGSTPDVGLGVASGSVGEFAIRNSVVAVSDLPNYDKIASRFNSNMMIPMQYNDKVYGIPETVIFKTLIYRKDIVERLGISIPKTWNELFNDVIPKLNQNNMQFNAAPGFDTLVAQFGGTYYKYDLKSTGLDSQEAFQAFQMMCEFYTLYGVPVQADFFNRFRTGEMPIGIADFNQYMMISEAAPELNGRWAIAPLPGLADENGEINNNQGSSAAESIIILSGSKKQEAAWEFVDWWTSEEIQTEFGMQIEALLGNAARWNTANLNAFSNMPWNKGDVDIMLDTLNNTKEYPVVLGGYFTARHITNASNRVIVSKMNLRDSWEKTIKDINKELMRKQKSAEKKLGENN